jgi:hypothetical protein
MQELPAGHYSWNTCLCLAVVIALPQLIHSTSSSLCCWDTAFLIQFEIISLQKQPGTQ